MVESTEESDACVVPRKSPNTWVTPVEEMEGRHAAEGKPAERNALRAQDRKGALTDLARVGERAARNKGERFVNLLSHVRVPLLKEAYLRLRKNAAAGVDGETWKSYGEQLDARLSDLQDRIHRGAYHPPPVRRVHTPKGDGRTRPLGIPSLEDKIVQQAVRTVIEPIYERSEFVGVSYGFRPGRSQHLALDALHVAICRKTSWVLDADIRSFFDTIDHGWMQKFIEHRIGDKRLVRLLMKWLHAGVIEDGEWHRVEEGTPQGGIISPLMANIYLHYVLDLWILKWRRTQARGQVYYVRYADDLVMAFEYEQDARAMRKALAERLVQFGLELHPDKTRVLRFGRFAKKDSALDGRQRPETFDFLGFTHICGNGRHGRFWLVRRTSRKKRAAKIANVKEQIRRRMHDSPGSQYQWLVQVLVGHYRYYGVPGNYQALDSFRQQIEAAWHRRLQRRSQRGRWNATQWRKFAERYPLPRPRIYHPKPLERFQARCSHPLT
ncbi:group II intron reverse transcriptase/maturase [Sorangium cellulosum]|nr:group II intron reverse transcriptase/maturase [Sorangium cellulosum]